MSDARAEIERSDVADARVKGNAGTWLGMRERDNLADRQAARVG